MLLLDSILLTGISKQSFEFNLYKYPNEWAQMSGVYAIIKRTILFDKYIKELIYIGETSDLANRFVDHHKQDCFHKNEAVYLAFLEINDEETRKQVENDLCKNYKPTCNDGC